MRAKSIGHYILGKTIGEGTFGKVKVADHVKSAQKVAIKIYEKFKLLDPQRRKSVRREIKLMERMRHPNIVGYIENFLLGDTLVIIMQYCERGDIATNVKRQADTGKSFTEAQVMNWFVHIVWPCNTFTRRRSCIAT